MDTIEYINKYAKRDGLMYRCSITGQLYSWEDIDDHMHFLDENYFTPLRNMTKSQKEIIDWHIKKGVIFNEILRIVILENKKVIVKTPALDFQIGIRGGISIKE